MRGRPRGRGGQQVDYRSVAPLPTIVTSVTNSGNSSSDHRVTLPATIHAGDVLLYFNSRYTRPLYSVTPGAIILANSEQGTVLTYECTGSEASTLFGLQTDSNSDCHWGARCYVLRGTRAADIVATSSYNGSTASSTDPSSVTAKRSDRSIKWITGLVARDGASISATWPSGYADLLRGNYSYSSVLLGSKDTAPGTASENPGSVSLSGSLGPLLTFTIAVPGEW